MLTAKHRAALKRRRPHFLAIRNELHARLHALEETWTRELLSDRSQPRRAIVEARAQLATAQADLFMVDRLLKQRPRRSANTER